MTALPYSITYGSHAIGFELIRSQRKTLQIAVYPDGSVVVRAPKKIPTQDIKRRIHKRARWIQSKKAFFAQYSPRTPERCYVSGESHRYLGRQYRLKVLPHTTPSVKLVSGRFFVSVKGESEPERVKLLLDRWYAEKARQHFNDAFDRCWPPFEKQDYPRPRLNIRTMKTRWGSLSSKGTLTLNTRLICAPRECIDYVLIHELCHLVHHNHSPAFYKLLERQMPQWKQLKSKLEGSLI